MPQVDTLWGGPAIQKYPQLERDLVVDAVVVGGGLTGILTAFLLAKDGASVAVLEAGCVGRGVSARTTAFLTQVMDTDLNALVNRFGRPAAQQIWASGRDAIDAIERITNDEDLKCDFLRCPMFQYAVRARDVSRLQADASLAQALGFETSFRTDDALGITNSGYLEVRGQAKLQPLAFLDGLAERARARGVHIFERSEVASMSRRHAPIVHTRAAKVSAEALIIATHLPIVKPKVLTSRKAQYRSYVLDVEIPRGVLLEALFVDCERPYHYVRVDAGSEVDRLLVGGSDHRDDLPVRATDNFAALDKYLRALLPGVTPRLRSRWSGPLIESIDGLPYIGEYAPQRYLATGFSGNGMTFGYVAAEILRDAVLGRSHPSSELFDPRRHQTWKQVLSSASHFVDVFFGGAVRNSVT